MLHDYEESELYILITRSSEYKYGLLNFYQESLEFWYS